MADSQYLSYWYTRHDLSIRLAMFFCMNFLAGELAYMCPAPCLCCAFYQWMITDPQPPSPASSRPERSR